MSFYVSGALPRQLAQPLPPMTASTNGLKAHANYAHYNASKAGVIALAKTFALELAPTVRVNAVCPGYIESTRPLFFAARTLTGMAAYLKVVSGLKSLIKTES